MATWIAKQCGASGRIATLGKNLSMPKFRLEKALMRQRQSWCTEGDGPGRCERGDRGHDRDRAFREKGPALYSICRDSGIKTLLTWAPTLGPFDSGADR